ncbi:DUF2652 domain-containing protein [Costertonia aggregata]|uniref:DUF2652 domain-containing protein n=1 Tax=Costertonia aggregata TaxID=343403 RepID=A0A7H9ASZ7_9FLAO|nr:DUF2652 domain-containing protein [Costertonia aggregata]QLG46556.1 DUF2652 domain-containing protein [Costertonia aggregata]
MTAQPTLLCIPDISGFTQFMREIDFELSSKVIPALLNQIIYSNEIGLKISEIEGDAVLFYRSGNLPTLKTLIDQCHYFHTEFYKRMAQLRKKHNGHEGANKIPELLGLKIILHFGEEVGLVPIGKNIKLMGEDVIAVHRLLKNNLATDEYILLSHSLLSRYEAPEIESLKAAYDIQSDYIDVDHLGKINFSYLGLKPI